VSVVIPTYNSERTLAGCLASIQDQDYPKDKIELIIVDGGSYDSTLDIASRFGVRILPNPLRSGEAGKAVGVAAARHEIIAFIDSDNILPSQNWLRTMVKPFDDQQIIGSEPLYYSYRREDPLITRYCSLVGMNDILCLYVGNYDRYCYLTDKWTSLKLNILDRGDYFLVELDEKQIPTMGANGFLVRREVLQTLDYTPYLVDVDTVYKLIAIGWNRFAKVKLGIVHLFAGDTRGYLRKTRRRVSDYLYYHGLGMRKYPWEVMSQKGMLKFILSTMFVPLLILNVARGYRKKPDRAWLFHVVACWITLLTYGSFYIVMLTSNRNSQNRSPGEG